ncbi:uncharacterized protein SCHCODRAFT_02558989 [Schizophyllum commune H4-8]|nr:uncharacterized protein SCHCODRAFT_02581992 [Schizophyllum commune H4-8]XP_050196854.1 uncharacterized protein SCHCODRAFT_02558989 [Schizophyllum commune H4-8]KAI5836576.1 hypothetical protein SCHCODRAFT_02558989 [Schizophyllum commune H4-8]KAI5891822.1 hypothetical protein SCHCODRAFT_02581992 [Schizophyllum commune H4-8]
MPRFQRSYWIKYRIPEPWYYLPPPGETGTCRIICILWDYHCFASQNYTSNDTLPLHSGIDILVGRIEEAIRKVPPGITVELSVACAMDIEVEYSAIDFLVENLLFIPGWDHLKMEFPPTRPIRALGDNEREAEGDFLARVGGRSRLIAALAGKRISFRGSRAEVPAPWYSLRALTRYGVANVDLGCKITSKDWYDLCYSSALDDISRYPLELTVDAIDRGGDAQRQVRQPHQGDEWPTHARPSLDNLLHPDNGACRVRKATVRADGLTWTYP